MLTRLILALNGAGGAPRTADRAWLLARELALADGRGGPRRRSTSPTACPTPPTRAYAAHWARTLEFLHIVTSAWPAWLAENGVMNPAARQVALLNAQAAAWEDEPPDHPVLIAGTTAGIPAVARLLRVVARLPTGAVVLPVLDTRHGRGGLGRAGGQPSAGRPARACWPGSDATRAAMCGPGAVAAGIGAVTARRDVACRRSARALAARRRRLAPTGRDRPAAAAGRAVAPQPADQQEEAAAIALVLREALETPGARAALVTPDRELAGRVAAALLRHGIVADDSAGEPLAETPPAVFLRLLARAVAEELAPVPLLALLKHPLAAAGLSPAACRAAARALEIACLRGPRPAPGLTGLRRALDRARRRTRGRDPAAPARSLPGAGAAHRRGVEVAPAEALAALIDAAERLAATDDTPGPALWAGGGRRGSRHRPGRRAGRAAASARPAPRRCCRACWTRCCRARWCAAGAPCAAAAAPNIPRVFIWGLLEARLQSVDVMVLGGLVEGVWPPATEPGPWLSRPMRATVGLPSPEEAVGQAAHDFAGRRAAAPRGRPVLSGAPRRRARACRRAG